MKKTHLKKRIAAFALSLVLCVMCLALYVSGEETVTAGNADSGVITLDYYKYHSGIVGGGNSGVLSNYDFDLRTVLKVTSNNKSSSSNVKIDGWNYASAGIDLRYYGWIAVEYYYECASPLVCPMNLGIMQGGVLTGSYYKQSVNDLVANEWSYAVFDVRSVKDKISDTATSFNMKQLHLEPFGNKYALSERPDGEVMYIGKIIFSKEKPAFDRHEPYMNGYTDGTFRPSGTMTRAEACTIVARILEGGEVSDEVEISHAFSDVTADKWYNKYIGYCASKGLLKSYTEAEFLPEKAITRAEFAELVYNTGLAAGGKGENKATFSDVPENHTKYDAIMAAASAGLIGGYSDGTFAPDKTVSRAEAVTIINRARGTSKKAEDIPKTISILFMDVDRGHWAFGDIAESTVLHTVWEGAWMNVLEDPVEKLMEKVDANDVLGYDKAYQKIEELDALEKSRIEEIRGTKSVEVFNAQKYYVAADGDDDNSGTSPEEPLKTVDKATSLAKEGDAVLFKRGDVFRQRFTARTGITYSAYGDANAPKPVINGSPEDGADAEKWSLVYMDNQTGAKIWKYSNTQIKDIGCIIFNGGEGYAVREVPASKKSQFIVSGSDSKQFVYTEELDKNLEFFHGANSIVAGNTISPSSVGPVYLRCDNGNPGKVFESIEFASNDHIITLRGSDITIDNLCIVYGGAHGIAGNTISNLKISNCEIGWIGGSVQDYGRAKGVAIRYGNGIEIYGGCDGYTVDNCYIYQCYDAGVTHQFSGGKGEVRMDDISYTNNVITDCVYSIEYFLDAGNETDGLRAGENHLIDSNLLRRAGFGFGSTRPDKNVQRHIRAGSANNFENVRITNNVFDRSVYELFAVTTNSTEYGAPVMDGNTYIQGYRNKLFKYGVGAGYDAYSGLSSEASIKELVCDKNAKVYIVPHISDYAFDYNTSVIDNAEYPLVEDDMSLFEERPPEILEPYFVKLAKHSNLYSKVGDACATTKLVDPIDGFSYVSIKPRNIDKSMVLDCYGLKPAIPLSDGAVFFKILYRTNHSNTVHLNVYNITDSEGKGVPGGHMYLYSREKTVASGSWEEIIIPATSVNSAYANATQIQIFFFENVGKGSDFYANGELLEDAYFDIAAWGVFANYESAQAITLKSYAGATE